jgi:GMP synthase-like glutamine amidotransferase
MRTPKVLIIQNDPMETLGAYDQYLKDYHISHQVFHAYKATHITQFPKIEDFDIFIVGPTPISANHVNRHPFLRSEWQYLAHLVKHQIPCLGVCCGAQLLMKLVGAEVTSAPVKEIGNYIVHLTQDGISDPLFKEFPPSFPVFQWHSDQFTVPPRGKHLISGDPCLIQAVSWKQIHGILFHLELNLNDVTRWTELYADELKAVGKPRTQILSECRETEEEMISLARQLMGNLLQH